MKPILFNSDMVNAILDGKKTMTRRVINKDTSNWFDLEADMTPIAYVDPVTGDSYKPTEVAPYQVGTILWVRETFWQYGEWYTTELMTYDHDACTCGSRVKHKFVPCETHRPIYYCDTLPADIDVLHGFKSGRGYYTRPSIYMPRDASRIFLKVTDVKVERIQDISIDDCISEGYMASAARFDFQAETWFRNLWDSLNEKRGYGWDSNPWVWCYEFERMAENEINS